MYAGRLLRKTENQYSDFYIQLAAHFLLEVYQETGCVVSQNPPAFYLMPTNYR